MSFVTFVAIGIGALVACSPFDASVAPSTTDAATSDAATLDEGGQPRDGSASGESDASGVIFGADGGILDAGDAGAPKCFDFRNGAGLHGFALQGAASIDNAGVHLPITSGGGAGLVNNFKLQGEAAIATSHFEIEISAAIGPEPFGAANGDYVDLIAQYYGDPPVYQGTAFNTIELAQGGTDLNVWWMKGENFSGSYFLGAPLQSVGTATLKLTTSWTSNGPIKVEVGGVTKVINTKVAEVPQKKITLVVGGSSGGKHPSVNMTVQRLCASLE